MPLRRRFYSSFRAKSRVTGHDSSSKRRLSVENVDLLNAERNGFVVSELENGETVANGLSSRRGKVTQVGPSGEVAVADSDDVITAAVVPDISQLNHQPSGLSM